MQREHIKKFEELFRKKYFEHIGLEDRWKEYLDRHNLNQPVNKNNNEMVIIRPWPDIPFAIPKSFFENTLILGDLP